MASKPSFAPTLETTRLNLILFDSSNPTRLELNVRLLHDPAFQSNFGDYGLRTQDDVRRLWASTHIKPTISEAVGQACPRWLRRVSEARPRNSIHPCYRLRSRRGFHLPLRENARRSYSGVAFSFPPSRYALPPDVGWGLWQEYANNGFASEAGKEALMYWRDGCEIKEIIA